ncbi:MAG: peptidylprolyl isomerase [Candidatus Sumerlaeia bacterium]|nr:peptidylprolyl isomerase [Candidatus Sumerlaeia bacterium]
MSLFHLLSRAAVSRSFAESAASAAPPHVVLKTNYGDIELELDPLRAPVTVQNFLRYVRSGHYDGTIFHRVIGNFMIQGGGMTADFRQKPAGPPIKNESTNGLPNVRGSIAMARTSLPDSATCQFFINVRDNPFLDGQPQKPGYAVFGKVVAGMDVVDKIKAVPTHKYRTPAGATFDDVPVQPVVIESAREKTR